MGEVSDLCYHPLARTSDNFIRLETLSEAKDRLSHALAALAIFHHYDIADTVHSTDTPGTNPVNLHLLGYQFAPRYKDIYDTVSCGLYGFKHPSYQTHRQNQGRTNHRGMGKYPAHHSVPCPENDDAKHHRWQLSAYACKK
jgi:hypothetical protein